ncbi:MAG: 50S ribosomal protein L31 [Rickettsiales bacterium]|jgi:large subunit ribosomal protein L31|nr:50S ribosomal protein L31 [Rickettsiales bacterium]
MPKKDIHPVSHRIKVMLSNGQSIDVESTWGTEGEVMKLDVDPTNHPAWRKDNSTVVNDRNDQVSKFKKKYGTAFDS